MNKLIFLTLVSLGISACSGEGNINSNTMNDSENESDLKDTEEFYTNEFDETLPPRVFKIDDFPRVWIRLWQEENSDEFFIQHTCEAELPQIWIEPIYGDKWELTILYGQDSDQWLIDDFKAEEKTMELSLVVIGSMKLYKSNNPSNYFISEFCWNKDEEHCHFSNIPGSGEFYINEEKQNVYRHEVEDCEGYWD